MTSDDFMKMIKSREHPIAVHKFHTFVEICIYTVADCSASCCNCVLYHMLCYVVNKVQGERFAGPVAMVFTIIGQQQCVKECRARPKLCKGVNYLKKHLLCDIVSSIEKSEPSSDYTRFSIDHVRKS